ncbi:cysteine desulfurase [Aminipila butyrica]|uniref:Cysteine desulfurase n=1 Tax=Aminipila butyrica TaxID=433296 RepID=A0A858BWA3_9FIRM|nr:cysteine desulfurase family protein [Aminipila butyrica]QIB69867.1 cysteine desulfurase [Aminipila butyrica]
MFVYLDNSSTTKPYREAAERMMIFLQEDFGNPSSLHRLGLTAEKAVKAARKSLGDAMGAREEEIIFTSGGTEADNTALIGAAAARQRRGRKVITTAVEHPAVLEAVERLAHTGFTVERIGVDQKGLVDMDALAAALSEDTILISVMGVNNEVGTIQPIQEIGSLRQVYNEKHGTDILFHTDAVQAFGKLPVLARDADLISLSGHKIHGPKGIGALYIRKGLSIEPYLLGGGQERHLRSGTENVPAIAGFGQAVQQMSSRMEERMKAVSAARARLLGGIQAEIPEVRLNSPETDSLGWDGGLCCPSVLNVSFLGTRGEVLLHSLEQADIYVSTGSACSSNKKGQSHVLRAMGLKDKEIEGAIRFSFSEFNTMEEIDYVVEQLKQAVGRFRKLGSFR